MDDSALGFAHFIAHADLVARLVLAAMLLASVASWSIIVDRLIAHWLQGRRRTAFFKVFGQIRSLAEADKSLPAMPDGPDARLARAALDATRHYLSHDASHLNAGGGLPEFLARTLRQAIDVEAERMERGLAVLASIGSTAPFVGLFGTVWGIYHALLAIGMSGQGTLDKVAGPIGEALIMTAIGLAVAIPAVLGYNALIRRNRQISARLDALGHDLLTLTVTGAPMIRGGQVPPLRIAGAA